MARPRKSIVHKDPKSSYWYYDWKIKGAPRLRGSTETEDRETAEAIALRARQKLIDQIRLGRPAPKPEWTVDQAAGMYWLEYASHLTRAADNAKPHVGHIRRLLGESTLCSSVDEAAMQRLIAGLRGTTWADIHGVDKKTRPRSRMHGKHLSSAYINRVLNTACKMFRYVAETHGVNAPKFSASKLHLQESEGREVFLSPDAGADFARKIVAHAQPIVDLAFMTGMRKGNLIGANGLTCEQCHLTDKPRITFTTKTRSRKVKRKVHTVPLIPEAVALLRRLDVHKRTGPVFLFGQNDCACQYCKDHGGEPILGIKRAFRTARKAIGREDFRIHDMRHSAASAILLETGNLELARRLLGHADLKTTSRYAHLLQARTVDALKGALSGFVRPTSTKYQSPLKSSAKRRKPA